MKTPRHVAIIMDGNGRWAQARGHSRIFGHVRGARVARNIIRESGRLGVEFLTLYAFSTENWSRPAGEVKFLMLLLERYLKKEQHSLMQENVKFRCIGDISKLPQQVQKVIADTVELTKGNTGLNLVFALNYGGRQELLFACKKLMEQVQGNHLDPATLDETVLSAALETSFMPDPDLIIRTSGERRLSNFLSWQSAYSELYFTGVVWPDFSVAEYHNALTDYMGRQRRFGSVDSDEPQSVEL